MLTLDTKLMLFKSTEVEVCFLWQCTKLRSKVCLQGGYNHRELYARISPREKENEADRVNFIVGSLNHIGEVLLVISGLLTTWRQLLLCMLPFLGKTVALWAHG